MFLACSAVNSPFSTFSTSSVFSWAIFLFNTRLFGFEFLLCFFWRDVWIGQGTWCCIWPTRNIGCFLSAFSSSSVPGDGRVWGVPEAVSLQPGILSSGALTDFAAWAASREQPWPSAAACSPSSRLWAFVSCCGIYLGCRNDISVFIECFTRIRIISLAVRHRWVQQLCLPALRLGVLEQQGESFLLTIQHALQAFCIRVF